MTIEINIESVETGFVLSLAIGDVVAVIDTHANYSDALDEAQWTCTELEKYLNTRCELTGV